MKNANGVMPPVIIIGMHRSGTNLVTRFLMQLGVFMGWLREGNSEAFFYQRKNEAIFSLPGATWDNPGPLELALRDTPMAHKMVSDLEQYGRSSKAMLYWGPWRWARIKSGLNQQNLPWGWKDPRNTFTLPLWLAVYPEARVINVVRNGVDIAASLKRREQKRLRTHKNLQHFSQRCLELAGGFSLWEEYVQKGLAHERALAGRCLRVKYEDFLAEPITQGERISDFLNLGTKSPRIQKAAEMINSSRGNAYLNDPELTAFYTTVKISPSLRALGYGEEE